MKKITTATEITFKKTGDKFTLTQTETGFDVRQVKLSKTVPAESYSFEELLDLYDSGKISIENFEDADAGLVRSILTGYMYNAKLKLQLAENAKLTATNAGLEKKIESLEETISAMQEEENA